MDARTDLRGLKAGESKAKFYVLIIAVLILERLIAAAFLPLYFGDEPYYWLWSQYPSWGYFDHPPAIAALIRLGAALFGKTEFGVRFPGIVLSIPMTLCVWRTGSLLLGGREAGALAALLFNLTLTVSVNTFMATPDAPALACSAAFLWALAELTASGDGRWWLAAGAFAGLGLLSKYTILCVGAGAVAWLLFTRDGRAWLKTPWPWLGGVIAALLFAPNLIWNANHDWGTLGFQLGRTIRKGSRWWSLPQFVAEQFILATPFIMILALRGLSRLTVSKVQGHALIAALAWPTIIFFTLYALQNRVHRNWPDVIYPALAVAAAFAYRSAGGSPFVRKAAIPVALVFQTAMFAGALVRVPGLDRIDPLKQHLASGMQDVVAPVVQAVAATGAQAIVTTDWRMTSWLRFYLPASVRVIQINEEFRYPDAPRATASDLAGTLLFVTMKVSPDRFAPVRERFSEIEPLDALDPPADGVTQPRSGFHFYRLKGFQGEPLGRLP